MFMCEQCAEEADVFFIPISYGPCEGCGSVGECCDR